VEEWGVLDTLQIQAMFFSNIEYGQRKAQERLLKLHRAGKLNRSRGEDCFFYFSTEKPPGMVKHLIATNWVRLWYQKNLASWEHLHSWSYELDYRILRCDGFVCIKNNMTGKFKFCFIEMDRGTNAFNKIELYNKLFDQQDKYLVNRWWFALTDVFPTVNIITTHPARKDLIAGQIEANNKNLLTFTINTLKSIKGEAVNK
jgi:hypothetical protein